MAQRDSVFSFTDRCRCTELRVKHTVTSTGRFDSSSHTPEGHWGDAITNSESLKDSELNVTSLGNKERDTSYEQGDLHLRNVVQVRPFLNQRDADPHVHLQQVRRLRCTFLLPSHKGHTRLRHIQNSADDGAQIINNVML